MSAHYRDFIALLYAVSIGLGFDELIDSSTLRSNFGAALFSAQLWAFFFALTFTLRDYLSYHHWIQRGSGESPGAFLVSVLIVWALFLMMISAADGPMDTQAWRYLAGFGVLYSVAVTVWSSIENTTDLEFDTKYLVIFFAWWLFTWLDLAVGLGSFVAMAAILRVMWQHTFEAELKDSGRGNAQNQAGQ